MEFADARVPFRINATFHDRAIQFRDTKLQVHVVPSSDKPLKPELTRLCGATLLGVSATREYFSMEEVEPDGVLRTLSIGFEGDKLMHQLADTYRRRRDEQKKHDASGDKNPLQFETTPAEALYFALITQAEIQLEVQLADSKEPARIIVGLYYKAARA